MGRFSYFSMLKRRFFDTAIADMCRAIRGGCLLGAFVQSVCAIDAMAYLCNALPNKGTRLNFERWVEDWMVPLNGDCRADALYALRCGLVHTHGYAKRMAQLGIEGFSLTHNDPELHWTQQRNNVYTLNLDSHVAEVIVAAWAFFDGLRGICAADGVRAHSVQNRAKHLLQVRAHLQIPLSDDLGLDCGRMSHTPHTFAEIDAALAVFDEKECPGVNAVAGSIRQLYSG